MWREQKKMPFIKPMVGYTPDSWVFSVLDPFNATHNNATILQDCFNRYENEMNILQEGDVVLVDKGFRDVLTC